MTQTPPKASFPWLGVIGVFVLAVIGVGLLAYAVYITTNPGPAAAQASATAPASQQALIPTTTPAPPTNTPAPSPTPAPTEAPTEPPTPEASPTPAASLSIVAPANIRNGPGLTYGIVGGMNTGETAPVIGRDETSQWYVIPYAAAPEGIGWVSNLVATLQGDLNSLPVIEASSPPPPPEATQPPAATAGPTNTTAPPATNTPVVSSAQGLVANYFRVRNTTAAVNEEVWFEFQVTNTSGSTVNFGMLAAHTDVGYTAQSWNAPIEAGKTLTWDDHMEFSQPGTYQVYLGVCFGSSPACVAGTAPWERLSPSVTVTIH